MLHKTQLALSEVKRFPSRRCVYNSHVLHDQSLLCGSACGTKIRSPDLRAQGLGLSFFHRRLLNREGQLLFFLFIVLHRPTVPSCWDLVCKTNNLVDDKSGHKSNGNSSYEEKQFMNLFRQ